MLKIIFCMWGKVVYIWVIFEVRSKQDSYEIFFFFWGAVYCVHIFHNTILNELIRGFLYIPLFNSSLCYTVAVFLLHPLQPYYIARVGCFFFSFYCFYFLFFIWCSVFRVGYRIIFKYVLVSKLNVEKIYVQHLSIIIHNEHN